MGVSNIDSVKTSAPTDYYLILLVVTIRSFLRHRKDLELLSSHSNGITSYRYFRLMLFASIDVLFLLPLNFYLLYLNQQVPFYPWKGLADLHFGFSFVGQIPTSEWRYNQSEINQVLVIPCTSIAACFVFFAFFGMAKESRMHYQQAFRSFTGLFARSARTADCGEKFVESVYTIPHSST